MFNQIFPRNTNQGFTLMEVMVVTIILGITAAVASPSLVGSWRQSKANEAFNQLKSALQQAQANANRLSKTCDVTITTTQISSTTTGCLQEIITIDSSLISVSPATTTVFFNLKGEPVTSLTNSTVLSSDVNLITVARKNGSTVDTSNANCLQISAPLGLIRTGKLEGTNCINVENLRYNNENPTP